MSLTKANNHKGNKCGLWIALIFLFAMSAKSQSDYLLSDPRNPNCPCHKYQQQAEEEYKKLLAQNNSVNSNEVKLNDDKHFDGVSNDALGNSPGNMNNQNFGGESADVLARINFSGGVNSLGVLNEESGELTVPEQKTDHFGSIHKEHRSSTSKQWKGKHKKHTVFHKQLKRIFYVGGWGIWKRKRNAVRCYHWK